MSFVSSYMYRYVYVYVLIRNYTVNIERAGGPEYMYIMLKYE